MFAFTINFGWILQLVCHSFMPACFRIALMSPLGRSPQPWIGIGIERQPS
jgi:hypothetical protein